MCLYEYFIPLSVLHILLPVFECRALLMEVSLHQEHYFLSVSFYDDEDGE